MKRRKSSSLWSELRKRDVFYKKAKERGYRSRSAFKLMEIVKKKRFIRPGNIVVDLGAAPGGWLQVAGDIIGSKGILVGVDTNPIKPLPYKNVKYVLMSIYNQDLENLVLRMVGRCVDVVLSDVSPDISGVWEVDSVKQIDLAQRSLSIASKILQESGAYFVKVFQSPDANDLFKKVKMLFRETRYVKPKASRPRSSEIYILGIRFKGSVL